MIKIGYISIYNCCHFAFHGVFCQRLWKSAQQHSISAPDVPQTPAVPRSNLEQTRRDIGGLYYQG